MISESLWQKGYSLIEVAMVLILSVWFVSGGAYVVALLQTFTQSYSIARDVNYIRDIINQSTSKFQSGSVYGAPYITGDTQLDGYSVYFGDDDYTLISGDSAVKKDVFYITCYFAKYNCVLIVDGKTESMSGVLPVESLSNYGINFNGGNNVIGILFKRD
ncbi:TPA: hypothetical protein M2Q89_004859 [Escherichia coli]|nr:hypothetical protein [Escherichia coli]